MRMKTWVLVVLGSGWLIATHRVTGKIDGLSLLGFFPALWWLAKNVIMDFE